MLTYKLRSHVRACVDGANLVFLDLRRDRYRAVRAVSAPRIVGVTEGGAEPSAVEKSLLELELIELADETTPPIVQRPRAPEQKLACKRGLKPSLGEAATFFSTCLRCSLELKQRRLDLMLASLQRRKALARGAASAERVAGIFEELRPWYPQQRVCLFDSLALMRFMLDHGLAPSLVFGVRTTPFSAHCWLELNGVLVSDTSDYCASFTPIAWV